MEKKLLTALLVLLLAAPQTGLEAKSRHHGVKDRDHDSKKHHYKARKNRHSHHHSSHKFYRFAHATKAELELLKQAIADLDAKIDALEPQGDLPADLAARLDALQMAIDTNSSAIDANSSDISLALSDIVGILMEIEKIGANTSQIDELKIAIADLGARLDALELKVDDHESRIAALENPAFVGVSFSGNFTQGVGPDDPTTAAWFEFKSKATGSFSSIEIRNNLPGPSVKCSDPDVATGIAKALNESILGSSTTFTCSDGRLWNVIPYGFDAELNVWTNAMPDQCDTYASVRPTKPTLNWGGIGNSCGQPDQTLEVLLAR